MLFNSKIRSPVPQKNLTPHTPRTLEPDWIGTELGSRGPGRLWNIRVRKSLTQDTVVKGPVGPPGPSFVLAWHLHTRRAPVRAQRASDVGTLSRRLAPPVTTTRSAGFICMCLICGLCLCLHWSRDSWCYHAVFLWQCCVILQSCWDLLSLRLCFSLLVSIIVTGTY